MWCWKVENGMSFSKEYKSTLIVVSKTRKRDTKWLQSFLTLLNNSVEYTTLTLQINKYCFRLLWLANPFGFLASDWYKRYFKHLDSNIHTFYNDSDTHTLFTKWQLTEMTTNVIWCENGNLSVGNSEVEKLPSGTQSLCALQQTLRMVHQYLSRVVQKFWGVKRVPHQVGKNILIFVRTNSLFRRKMVQPYNCELWSWTFSVLNEINKTWEPWYNNAI